MTKDEIVETLKQMTFTCKGYLSPVALAYKAQMLKNPETKPLAEAIAVANRGRRDSEPIVIELTQPTNLRLPPIAHLSNGMTEAYQPRPACGSNFMRQLLLDRDFDGQVHEYQCPDCGVTGIYQAPAPN